MIKPVLNMLIDQLSGYMREVGLNIEDPPVVLGNIGMAEGLGGNNDYMNHRIVLSLVNIVEEPTLKNLSQVNKTDSRFEETNPPEYVNLFLLFTANSTSKESGSEAQYVNDLMRLSQVIEFFQSRKVFSFELPPTSNILRDSQITHVKVTLQMVSLTFEQINHLWGSLGGKQVPFIMYKAGILPIKRDNTAFKEASRPDSTRQAP